MKTTLARGEVPDSALQLSPTRESGTGGVTALAALLRAPLLIFGVLAAVLGGAMAWRVDFFHGELWLACGAGILLAQVTANLIHSALDARRGYADSILWRVDAFEGRLSTHLFIASLLLAASVALVCGLWLASYRGGATFDLMLAAIAITLFYVSPLRRYGLGEIAALVVWGPLAVHGTFYVVAGGWSPELVLVSLLLGIGPCATLVAEHVDRRDRDDALAIKTLPVVFGASAMRTLVKWSIAAQYALLCTLFYTETLGWPLLLVLLCATRVPPLWQRLTAGGQDPVPAAETHVPPGVAKSAPLVEGVFSHARLFNTAFVCAVIVAVVV